jgi:DNA-binding transcriptional MerR regulator
VLLTRLIGEGKRGVGERGSHVGGKNFTAGQNNFSKFLLTLTLRDTVCLCEMEKEVNKAGGQSLPRKRGSPGYTVKKLADLAGVSVRTLHLYDEIGLLKPLVRTEAGYRVYGQRELLRLQQVLFYKELDIPLQHIREILDDPNFDIVQALENHREALRSRKMRLTELLDTIDNTINKIKNGMALSHEELYRGFPDGKAEEWRNEAIGKYGAEAVERSETYLKKMGKEDFEKLNQERVNVTEGLLALINDDPSGEPVQRLIAKHYEIIRKFWGTYGHVDNQAEAYAGLGELYVSDERFTTIKGQPNPAFAEFMRNAMTVFAAKLRSFGT